MSVDTSEGYDDARDLGQSKADIVERMRKSLDPFWYHTRNDLIVEAMSEIKQARGNIRLLLEKQQELMEALLDLAKNSPLPAKQVFEFEEQLKASAAAIAALPTYAPLATTCATPGEVQS